MALRRVAAAVVNATIYHTLVCRFRLPTRTQNGSFCEVPRQLEGYARRFPRFRRPVQRLRFRRLVHNTLSAAARHDAAQRETIGLLVDSKQHAFLRCVKRTCWHEPAAHFMSRTAGLKRLITCLARIHTGSFHTSPASRAKATTSAHKRHRRFAFGNIATDDMACSTSVSLPAVPNIFCRTSKAAVSSESACAESRASSNSAAASAP